MISPFVMVRLSVKSLVNRRLTAGLTVFAVALSVLLLLGVEKVRTETKASFANTISGTDLVVGARSGEIQLLLYSVFRIGSATNNVSWTSYQSIAARPEVAWTIPMSLGDSHRGFRVLGTNRDYFRHYRYGRRQPLKFSDGKPFDDLFEVVLGADVARELSYRLDNELIVTHGIGRGEFSRHDNRPFKVSGILRKTGTPIDRTVHISLQGFEAMHVDWRQGAPIPGLTISADEVRKMKLQPRAITAFLVGLKSRFAIFGMQRRINNFPREPLLAVLPGVALQKMWGLMGTAEVALAGISIFVVVIGLLVMLAMLLSSLNERRREMAILRSVGARPGHIFSLFLSEAGLLTVAGAFIGVALLYISMAIAQPIIDNRFGLFLTIAPPTAQEIAILGLVVVAGLVAGALPAYRAYRASIADGLAMKT